MKLGIYGGSFNPPHISHLWVAQQVLDEYKLDFVWLIPNYTSEFYNKKDLIEPHHRNEMCSKMISDYYDIELNDAAPIVREVIRICKITNNNIDIENKFKYTYQTIEYLRKKIIAELYLIIGSDWDITKFKNYEYILRECKLIKVKRIDSDFFPEDYIHNFDPQIQTSLSSTIIRNRIKSKQKITCLVTQSVEKYIKERNLYVN